MTTKHQSVVTIDADNFEQEVIQAEQAVLVDFGAEWCPPCKAIAPMIEELATEYEGVARVGTVDVDENKSLAERYAIGSIPTLLFFKDGEVVDRIQGLVPKSEIDRKLAALSSATPVENS